MYPEVDDRLLYDMPQGVVFGCVKTGRLKPQTAYLCKPMEASSYRDGHVFVIGGSGSGKSIVVLGTAPPDSVAQGPGSSGDLPLPPSTIATIYQVRATEIPLLLHAGLCTPDPTSP